MIYCTPNDFFFEIKLSSDLLLLITDTKLAKLQTCCGSYFGLMYVKQEEVHHGTEVSVVCAKNDTAVNT